MMIKGTTIYSSSTTSSTTTTAIAKWFLFLFLIALGGDGGRNKGYSMVDGFLHSTQTPTRSITTPYDNPIINFHSFPPSSSLLLDCERQSSTLVLLLRPVQQQQKQHHCRRRRRSRSPTMTSIQAARMGKSESIVDDDSSSSDDDDDDIDEIEYQRKLEEAKAAIEEAKKARDEYYYGKNQKKKNQKKNTSSFLKADEISNLLDDAAEANKRRRDSTMQQRSAIEAKTTGATMSPNIKKKKDIPIRSRIEYTDAGTMNILIPSPGTSTSSVFAGAFTAAWFSAIIPATLSTGGAGLLFMLPFWAAGGLVAKQAVVDPYISYSLSIGQYAWSLQQAYLKSKQLLTKKIQEGSTNQLYSANVELSIIMNDIPQYEIRLLYSQDDDGDGTTTSITTTAVSSFGLGLPQEELEYLAEEINKHIDNIQNFPDESQLPSSTL